MSRTLKKSNAPAEDRTGDLSIYSLALYHVAIKAGLYRKAVQVYYRPNLYPVTFSPSILNLSSICQEYKNHWKCDLWSLMHLWVIYVGRHLSRTVKKIHAPAEDRAPRWAPVVAGGMWVRSNLPEGGSGKLITTT